MTDLVGEGSVDGSLGVGVELGSVGIGEVDFRGGEGGGGNKVERRVSVHTRRVPTREVREQEGVRIDAQGRCAEELGLDVAAEGWAGDVPDELPGEPEEGLLEVVVGLGRDLKVLEVLLSVERDSSSLDLSLLSGGDRHKDKRSSAQLQLGQGPQPEADPARVAAVVPRGRRRLRVTYLDVDLVSAEDDGDVLADSLEVAVPVGHVLVRDPRGHVEHDDSTLALDVVSITQST